jgi:predicted esterase
VIERTIATTTHGRYLVRPSSAAAAAPLLVGFHGYGETAETQMNRLRAIPGADHWHVVSIQGLHRFYQRRTNEVIASWMTRQDRELAIADNVAFVAEVIDTVVRDWRVTAGIVWAGFSQGVAMMFRAATNNSRPIAGIISAGGDVPPEIDTPALRRVASALVCRGSRDTWYSVEKFGADTRRLREAGVCVQPLEFDGGHEWSSDVIEAAAAFLHERRP